MSWSVFLWMMAVFKIKNVCTVLRPSHLDTSSTTITKSLQSCPILCNPIDGSPPGSPVPGILQARTLEWVALSFSNAWKWKVKVKSLSHVWPSATPWTAAYQAPPSMGFSRQEYCSGVPLPSPGYFLWSNNVWPLNSLVFIKFPCFSLNMNSCAVDLRSSKCLNNTGLTIDFISFPVKMLYLSFHGFHFPYYFQFNLRMMTSSCIFSTPPNIS